MVFHMTCDRPCMLVRGVLIHPGTAARYVSRVPGSSRAVVVRMADGSTEIVEPSSFRQWRELEDFKRRALHAVNVAQLPNRLKEVIQALPDTDRLRELPAEVHTFVLMHLQEIGQVGQ